MSGNSIGKNFVLTTFGESHGIAIGGIIDGCPPNIALDRQFLQNELDRRKPGTSRHVTPRQEDDILEILSGEFDGKTTGTPIGFIIKNNDQRSQDYGAIKKQFRPGHADYTYHHKYGIRDYRGGGRASARETAARVAGGALAKLVLANLANVVIRSYVCQIGTQQLHFKDWQYVNKNPFSCPNDEQPEQLERYLYETRKNGDSLGACVVVVAENVPRGLGEPVFDRLDADIAKALMSINASKGVEIGDGFAAVAQKGSEHRDEINSAQGFTSNRAGGILGGISSGQNIVARVAFKPTSSIAIAGKTIDVDGADCDIVTKGRHDPCVGLRAGVIVEAMLALVLCDHLLRDRGQNFQRHASLTTS